VAPRCCTALAKIREESQAPSEEPGSKSPLAQIYVHVNLSLAEIWSVAPRCCTVLAKIFFFRPQMLKVMGVPVPSFLAGTARGAVAGAAAAAEVEV
jgi:hypothetical protein